jgi:hypothetical protein
LVSTAVSGATRSGASPPSMRSWGGEPVVMCRSEAPCSTMALSSCCRLMPLGAPAVAMSSSVPFV